MSLQRRVSIFVHRNGLLSRLPSFVCMREHVHAGGGWGRELGDAGIIFELA